MLIGDGWVKDGDYNTSFSKTVLPLPSHDQRDYDGVIAGLELEDDPVYRRHPHDWQTYHTRFVTPVASCGLEMTEIVSPARACTCCGLWLLVASP